MRQQAKGEDVQEKEQGPRFDSCHPRMYRGNMVDYVSVFGARDGIRPPVVAVRIAQFQSEWLDPMDCTGLLQSIVS